MANDEWATPRWIVDWVSDHTIGGPISTDVAASSDNHVVDRWFGEGGEHEDGLATKWEGKCWMNPPYSNPLPWVQKAIDESKEIGTSVTALLPMDFSTKWGRLAWENATDIIILNPRVAFIDPATKLPVKGNNKGSIIVFFSHWGRQSDFGRVYMADISNDTMDVLP